MVVALGPGRFYGSSLPRPRIYTDVKFSSERVDPPLPVMDPLLSWAHEAHWSMGGLSFHRHRLQGRIEGNVQRLRSHREKITAEVEEITQAPVAVKRKRKTIADVDEEEEKSTTQMESPEAPIVAKRKRRMVDEVEDEVYRRRTVRKLKEEFDMVATWQSPVKPIKKIARGGIIGRRLIKGLKAVAEQGKRTSPGTWFN